MVGRGGVDGRKGVGVEGEETYRYGEAGTRTEYRGEHYRQQPTTTLCHSRGSHYLLFEETFCSEHFVILRGITLDRLIYKIVITSRRGDHVGQPTIFLHRDLSLGFYNSTENSVNR